MLRQQRSSNVLLTLIFAFAGAGTVFAQEATPPPSVVGPGDQYVDFAWGGLQWRMQRWFYKGVRPDSLTSKELLIQLRWVSAEQQFVPVTANKIGVEVDVHVRKTPFENPKLGLETVRRLNADFGKSPALSSVAFQGMHYVGSSSGIHFFTLDAEDVYVSCHSVEPDRLRTQLPILSQKYTCNTLFELPNATFA
jgi:hypothetical protein